MASITGLLVQWKDGDTEAGNQLFNLIYQDLHLLAQRQRKGWEHLETFNTTALVHELFLKWDKAAHITAEDRRQLYFFAAHALRNILVDYARSKKRKKRGGSRRNTTLHDIHDNSVALEIEDILALNSAIDTLRTQSTRLADVVELHFFGGFSYTEIADTLGVTKRTVARDWLKAKTLLYRTLR